MFILKNREIQSVEFQSKESPAASTKFTRVQHMELSTEEFVLHVPSGVFTVYIDEIKSIKVTYKNGDVLEYSRDPE